jgi:hypothetical protein
MTDSPTDPQPEAASLHEAGYQHREKTAQFKAADPKRQIVFGAALVPDSLDHQGDFLRKETIRDLSEGFMADLADSDADPPGEVSHVETSGLGGVMHATFEQSHLTLVENTVLSEDRTVGTGPSARTFKAGTWLQAWRIEDDQLWSLIYDRDVLSGYSIGMWVTDAEKYAPGDLPEDVRVPSAVQAKLAANGLDINDVQTGKIKSGEVFEISMVDDPSVPEAVHIAHKTASNTGWETDTQAFESARNDQPSYALAKAAGALTESYDSCVAYLRDRGHSEDEADELASYLQRVADDEPAAGKESAWTRIKSVFGDSEPDSTSLNTDELPAPLSAGSQSSVHTAPGAEIPVETHSAEKVGRTLSERNERFAMALRDLSLLLLRDADRDGGRMLFAEDPEYSYDADLTDVLGGNSAPESGSNSGDTSTNETEQLIAKIFENGSGGVSGSGEST